MDPIIKNTAGPAANPQNTNGQNTAPPQIADALRVVTPPSEASIPPLGTTQTNPVQEATKPVVIPSSFPSPELRAEKWFQSDQVGKVTARQPFYMLLYQKLKPHQRILTAVAVVAVLLVSSVIFSVIERQRSMDDEPVYDFPTSKYEQYPTSFYDASNAVPDPVTTPPSSPSSGTTTSRPGTTATSTQSTGTGGGGNTAPPPAPQNQSHAVSYTTACYSPSSLTIKAGDTVVFTNNTTNKPMWPASDDHPSHTDYPGFDAATDISPGQTYSFTFTTKGIWGTTIITNQVVEVLLLSNSMIRLGWESSNRKGQ